MTPVVRISVEGLAARQRLDGVRGSALVAALSRGLGAALEEAAGAVVLAAARKGLTARTGQLLSSVRGALDRDGGLAGEVGVPEESLAARYAWRLTDARFVIAPRQARMLAIPAGRNLTAAGVPRYRSPRQVPGGKFRVASVAVDWEGGGGVFTGLTYGLLVGERYEPLFVLLGSAMARGVNVLRPTMEMHTPRLVASIEAQLDKLIGDA